MFDIASIGGGFVLGIALGYALKKISKLVLLLGGILLVALFLLEQAQTITIHNQAVLELANSVVQQAQTFGSWIVERLRYTVGPEEVIGALTGLAAGIKMA